MKSSKGIQVTKEIIGEQRFYYFWDWNIYSWRFEIISLRNCYKPIQENKASSIGMLNTCPETQACVKYVLGGCINTCATLKQMPFNEKFRRTLYCGICTHLKRFPEVPEMLIFSRVHFCDCPNLTEKIYNNT